MDGSLPITGAFAGFVMGGILLMVRIAALLSMVPGFRDGAVPMRVRVLIAAMIAMIIDISSGGMYVPVPDEMLTPVMMAIREFLLGMTLGFAVRLLIATLQAAGSVASYSMALSMNTQIDPTSGDESMSLGSLFSVSGSLMFIALDGHHMVILTFFEHVKEYPVGMLDFYLPDIAILGQAAVDLCITAFLLASPVIIVALTINIGLAFVGKMVPQVNIFGVGLSLLMLAGLVSLELSGDAIIQVVELGVEELPEKMLEFTGTPIRGG